MTYQTQHLIKRPSGFYFRLVVPKSLRLALGKSEIRHPLRTSSEFVAIQLSKRLWSHYQSVFESLGMNRSKFNFPVFGYEVEELTITEKGVTLKGVKTDGEEDSKSLLEFTQKIQRSLLEKTDSLVVTRQIDHASESDDERDCRLSSLSAKFLNERKRAEISSDQLNKIRVAHEMLIEIVGDKDINSVKDVDVEKTKDLLAEVPKFRTNTPLYNGKSLRECIELAKKHGKDTLHTTTIDQNLQKLSGLFEWAIKKRYLKSPVNVFEGQTNLTKEERTKNTLREQFSQSELKKIFDHETYKKIKNPFIFWAPLLSVLCGARISEIAQLKVSDIRNSNRIHYLNLRSSGENTEKGFKTTSSERIVPIHKLLIDIGFASFVRDVDRTGSERLFPHIEKSTKGSYGTNASKQFQYHLRNKLHITEEGKVFHSFRKNFGDALKQQGVDISSRCELMGHKFEHVSEESYANLTRLALKKKWIHKPFWKFLELDKIKYEERRFDNFRTTGGGSRKKKGK